MSMTSVIRYVLALDTSVTDGSGKMGLAFSAITAKYLTQGGVLTSLTTETITTLGTYQAPSDASHIRIKELAGSDPSKGIYEVHFHNTQVVDTGNVLWLFLSATGARFQPLQLDLIRQTGDTYGRLGQPAGASIAADISRSIYPLGAVWVDTLNGVAGSVSYVNGTPTNPSSNIADARTIQVALKLATYRIVGGSSITLAAGAAGMNWYGENWNLVLNSQNIGDIYVEGATVSGLSVNSSGGNVTFRNCKIGTLTVKPGTIDDSDFISGNTLTVLTAGEYGIHHCKSGTGGYTFDFGAVVGATTFSIGDWDGPLTVLNMKAGDVLDLQGRGFLTLDSTCTAGTVNIRGAFDVTNNGSGQTITQTANLTVISTAVAGANTEPTGPPAQTASLGAKLAWIFTLGKNKRTQTPTTEQILSDADGVTPIGSSTKTNVGTTFTRGKYI